MYLLECNPLSLCLLLLLFGATVSLSLSFSLCAMLWCASLQRGSQNHLGGGCCLSPPLSLPSLPSISLTPSLSLCASLHLSLSSPLSFLSLLPLLSICLTPSLSLTSSLPLQRGSQNHLGGGLLPLSTSVPSASSLHLSHSISISLRLSSFVPILASLIPLPSAPPLNLYLSAPHPPSRIHHHNSIITPPSSHAHLMDPSSHIHHHRSIITTPSSWIHHHGSINPLPPARHFGRTLPVHSMSIFSLG